MASLCNGNAAANLKKNGILIMFEGWNKDKEHLFMDKLV